MAKYRIEQDSLGEVHIPSGVMYGAQTQRAVDNFSVTGQRPWRAFIWSVAAVKKAAAGVNASLGLLDQERSKAIAQAAGEVMEGVWDQDFVVDPLQAGAGTSHNMNANEVIANRATQIMGGKVGEYRVHPNDHVNISQSTNDVIPTAIRLGCLWRQAEIIRVLDSLSNALDEKAVEFDEIVKSGRTHLQDAVPIRLGQEFGAYALAVKRDSERIAHAATKLRILGIGGTAAGTGLNAHPDYASKMVEELKEICAFELLLAEDLFESMQSMADLADYSGTFRTLAITLTRIANDLRLLSSGPSTGLDEIRLPPVQPGSSIMPGKVNPVMAEMLNMAMFHVQGCDTTVSLASQAGQLELNVMMPVIAHNLFEMMQVCIGSVDAFTKKCVRGIKANPGKAADWLSRNAIIVTALNPLIGYRAGAEIVQQAMAEDKSVREIAIRNAKRGELLHIREDRTVSMEEVESALNDLRKLSEGGIFS